MLGRNVGKEVLEEGEKGERGRMREDGGGKRRRREGKTG